MGTSETKVLLVAGTPLYYPALGREAEKSSKAAPVYTAQKRNVYTNHSSNRPVRIRYYHLVIQIFGKWVFLMEKKLHGKSKNKQFLQTRKIPVSSNQFNFSFLATSERSE